MPLFEETQEQKLERIVEEYSTTLLRVALNQTSSRADAEDAVQSVFLKLLKNPPEFESAEHEKAWLLRVTINQCRDMMRSAWNKKTTGMDETLAAKEPEGNLEVLEAVRTLPEKYRTVVYLYYYEGYSTAEIAALLETRQGTVESRLHRARKKLEVLLKGGWD